MPFVTRDGARLYWRSDGDPAKPALLLGNSLGTDHALWNPVLPALMRRFHVLRFDMRGHGASEAPAGAYSIEALARDALAIADAAGAQRFCFMGISIGGMLGQWLGAHAGDRVERLVLSNTTAVSDPAIWADRIAKVRAGGTASIAEAVLQRWFTAPFQARQGPLVATTRTALTQTGSVGYLGCCAAIRDMDLRPLAASIRVPTLVVTGTHDLSTPKAQGEAIAAAIPGAVLTELPFAHIPVVEAPGPFVQAVVPFLAGSQVTSERERFEVGLARRKEALGAPYVESRLGNATAFNREFQQMITRYAWGEIWTRENLDDRMRRLLVLAITVSLGRWEEFDLHARAGLEAELTPDDVKEMLMLAAVYAGVPAANTGFSRAAKLLEGLKGTSA
jgi:3-oxoadipate enol-lactonase / 4-carboxymuconolactone decarboxylase